MLKITIPLEPRTKKNSQKIIWHNKRPLIVPSDQYTEYEKNCGWFLPKGRKIDRPVNVQCVFYMKTKRKCDLTNLLEAIDDILVKHDVLTDDNYNIIAAHDGSRVYNDRDHPRTEIIIEEIRQGNEQEINRASEADAEHTSAAVRSTKNHCDV